MSTGKRLRDAAKNGDLAKVTELLDAGVDVNSASQVCAATLLSEADLYHFCMCGLMLIASEAADDTLVGWKRGLACCYKNRTCA